MRYYFVTWEASILDGRFWRCVDMYYNEFELEPQLKILMQREARGEIRNINVKADCR